MVISLVTVELPQLARALDEIVVNLVGLLLSSRPNFTIAIPGHLLNTNVGSISIPAGSLEIFIPSPP
jgi:hypothetical protein